MKGRLKPGEKTRGPDIPGLFSAISSGERISLKKMLRWSMLYFAYGSNMAAARLKQRIPSAQPLGVARLHGYRLAFQVASTKDGSGKCDACPGNPEDILFGVLYRIDPAAKAVLDGYEGVGIEYRDVWLEVETEPRARHRALIYLGINIDPTLRPYPWYVEHVLRGALENQLPENYIAAIKRVPSMADPDPQRVERELNIYRNLSPED